MSGKEMVKQKETLTVVPVLTHLPVDGSTMLTVNGLPQNQAFLYPAGAQEALTSSLSVYCAVSSQSSVIIPTNTFRPGIITSSLPHDNLIVTPGVIGQIQSVQLPANSLVKTDVKDINITSEPLSPSTEVCECRWMNCTARFIHLDDLVNHVNDHHVKVERPDVDFQCRWTGCPRKGRGFNARYKMLIHVRTHTNEKPHKCLICGKCFSRLENLKIHNRSHTGEKPYICPFPSCNKAYSNSSDRFKHVRTHQEEKPYICKMPGCNKRYTDPSSLRKHVRTHKHHVKDDQSLPSVVQADTAESIYSNRQIVTLAPVLNYQPLNSHNQSTNSTHPSKEVIPQNILHSASASNGNLVGFSSSLTSAISPSASSVPKSSSSESVCQDSPLDLSRSPLSTMSSSPSVT